MPRQQPKFTKLKYFVTLTCSHGGVKVKMKCMLHIYIVPGVDWYHHWRNRSSSFSEEKRTQTATSQTSKFQKSKYFATLTGSHSGVKVKMKCTLHIYIVPSVDWYNHWRNRSSSFRGEANTNWYPSGKIIHKIEVFRDLDLQSWRGQGQNEVHVAHLYCSLS